MDSSSDSDAEGEAFQRALGPIGRIQLHVSQHIICMSCMGWWLLEGRLFVWDARSRVVGKPPGSWCFHSQPGQSHARVHLQVILLFLFSHTGFLPRAASGGLQAIASAYQFRAWSSSQTMHGCAANQLPESFTLPNPMPIDPLTLFCWCFLLVVCRMCMTKQSSLHTWWADA